MGSCLSNKVSNNESEEERLIPTPNEIKLVRNSWKFVAEEDGFVKYGTNMMIKVFIEHKELKPLWKFAVHLQTQEDMSSSQMLKAHGEKLFSAIDLAVSSLDDMGTLVPMLVQLGYGHQIRGVKEQYFPYIGEALISTLEDGLKEKFSSDVKKSWVKLFKFVEYHMVKGLRQAENAASSK